MRQAFYRAALSQFRPVHPSRSFPRQRTAPRENAAPEPSESGLPATLAALYRQMEGLPPNEREVVDLLYFHGLSQAEAAARLGLAERTVRRHWTVAKIKLFEGLKDFRPGSALAAPE
jgi:RNA polymerase sigma factor (sigma-70 family)